MNAYFPVKDEIFNDYLNNNPGLLSDFKRSVIQAYPTYYTIDKRNYFIPYRIGYIEPYTYTFRNEIEEILTYCLYTRHHNGYVREKYLKKLLDEKLLHDYAFINAFIIRLLGEYVLEIWTLIYDNKAVFNNISSYNFIKENPEILNKNIARAITYSTLYYSHVFKDYRQSPAYKSLHYLSSLNILDTESVYFFRTSFKPRAS